MTDEPDTTITVLDHIDGISVPGEPLRAPVNEYSALVCFRRGLQVLHDQASKYDAIAQERLGAKPGSKLTVWGPHERLSEIPLDYLTCVFHWYAITACQYVRVIGEIAHRQDGARPTSQAYAADVIPAVLAFRDKVAAHLAGMTRNSHDSDAERAISLMPPVGFSDGAFHVGLFTMTMRKAGQQSDSAAIVPWSIAGVHEQLRQRYWPQGIGAEWPESGAAGAFAL